ncbi:hypothetical protein LDVICp212 [lymphocystis disease virus-China]|uniref:Uncharacterized protein n=1 Tax=lymphocystis disease virus-China TaxID=256729 RepID=Q677Q2_9VIRU|nr:hypothetical protein LDVICp212 [lymphocystis disease virus-China]AAU11055.1 hypothetical protein [lymphocystis disease virus-China]
MSFKLINCFKSRFFRIIGGQTINDNCKFFEQWVHILYKIGK